MAFGVSNDKTTRAVLEKYPYIEELVDTVHGSGIDYDWTAKESQANIRLYNSFHLMNEGGYYYANADFIVVIPKDKPMNFKIQYQGDRSRYYAEKHMLTDYLGEDIAYALEKALQKRPMKQVKKPMQKKKLAKKPSSRVRR